MTKIKLSPSARDELIKGIREHYQGGGADHRRLFGVENSRRDSQETNARFEGSSVVYGPPKPDPFDEDEFLEGMGLWFGLCRDKVWPWAQISTIETLNDGLPKLNVAFGSFPPEAFVVTTEELVFIAVAVDDYSPSVKYGFAKAIAPVTRVWLKPFGGVCANDVMQWPSVVVDKDGLPVKIRALLVRNKLPF